MYGENKQDEAANTSSEFAKSVLESLSTPQKTLACRWLYDARGSALFEAITELPEYYPTRTEIGILTRNSALIADAVGDHANIVEFGAGAGTKTRLLLDALHAPQSYSAIDISADFLEQSMRALANDYPAIKVTPIVANFMSSSALIKTHRSGDNRVGFFPGSTIGNLSDAEILTFLSSARENLGSSAKFLIGVDLAKSEDILIPAYDDARGVTANFNLNLLTRINREIDGHFDTKAFKHEARWNNEKSRVEMHLVSLKEQNVRIGRHVFSFKMGETIHTENSRKFRMADFANLTEKSGWTIQKTWMDDNNYFCVALLG